jgi:hypothetical protein
MTTFPTPQDAAPKESEQEDDVWVDGLSRLPAAKPILQHFAAFDALVKSGGQKGAEPSVDQVATWRRLFCWMYRRTDTPFGIVSPITSSIPKCIVICNLSGNRAFYFSDTFSLGRILCQAAQEKTPRILAGVEQVFKKAQEIDASVIVLFCLPFQSGMERCYWEVRTIRKTKKGAIKDGEMFFSVNDKEARVVPCTLVSEHWPDTMFDELCKTFKTVMVPVCLDHVEDTDNRIASMSLEQATAMIGILKMERKKLMDGHKRSMDALNASSQEDVRRLNEVSKDIECKANARVSRVVEASKVAEDTVKKKMAAMEEHNADLMKQVASQRTAVDMANSIVAGMTLEHEQEVKEAKARQKALESQVSSLQSNHAKQVAEQTKARKDMIRSHQNTVTALKVKLEDSQRQAVSTNTAAALVSKSADEARRAQRNAEEQSREALLQVAKTKAELEDLKNANDSAATFLPNLKKQVDDTKFEMDKLKAMQQVSDVEAMHLKSVIRETEEAFTQMKAAANEAEAKAALDKELLAELQAKVDDVEAEKEAAVLVQKELKETKAELGRKEHLLKETEKRTKALESRIRDLEAEIKEIKKQKRTSDGQYVHASSPPLGLTTASAVPAGNGHAPQSTHPAAVTEEHTGPVAQATVHVNQNTVYMQNGAMHNPQQHGFPAHGKFVVDPMLEGMISQLHSALQTITAAARSANSSTRAAEMSQAKLDALMAQSGNYYDNFQQMQPPFFPAGNGSF